MTREERLRDMIDDFEDTYGRSPSQETIDQWAWQLGELNTLYDDED